jgi:hypothetical protein
VRRRIQSGLIFIAAAIVAVLGLSSAPVPAFAGSAPRARSTRVARSTRAARSARLARSARAARSTRSARFVGPTRTPLAAERPLNHTTFATRVARVPRELWTPLFRPSHESMVIQNEEIDRLGLPRIQNEEQLEELIASGDLLPIVPNETLRIDPRLDPERRYCLSWTLDFVNDLSEAFFHQFHDQIQINSAVRTAEVQERLRRYNRNAAAESGDLASSHLAGITVDIQRMGMTMPEIKWVEQYMLPLHEAGLIEPEEERHQRCFHVMVSNRYEDWRDSQSRDASDEPQHVSPADPVAPDNQAAPAAPDAPDSP